MNSAARAEITTVIPVYNGEKHLLHTLQSLARQTRRPDRVIAVDDGSTDKTQQIVEQFRELRCEWAPNPKNLGLFPNHNSAIRFAAETKFLHILHANDLIAPRFFENLVPLIENSEGYALAYSGHVFIREDGSETVQKGGIRGDSPRRLTLAEFLARQSELQAIQLHSAVIKTDYRPLPVSFRTDLPQVGDVIFHAEFATHCSEIWADPEILCQVRIHADSASTKNLRNANAWVRDEWKAMQIVYDLMSKKKLAGSLRKQQLKLLFAARSRVKMKMVAPSFPDYAREIAGIAKAHAGGLTWFAAGRVVALRDALFPKADAAHERITEPRTKK
jgi:glycosyltransferase involved in cell wall biosynthesis